MKTFTFRYDPNCSMKKIKEEMEAAIETDTPLIELDQLKSSSLKALLSVATENRLELFRLIHDKAPESFYHLSKMFGVDLSYISREVKVLEGLGLIKIIEEVVAGRERLRPVALYDRIVFDFDLA